MDKKLKPNKMSKFRDNFSSESFYLIVIIILTKTILLKRSQFQKTKIQHEENFEWPNTYCSLLKEQMEGLHDRFHGCHYKLHLIWPIAYPIL